MLAELFHWSPGDLAQTDIDLIFPMVVYYPHWKAGQSGRTPEKQVFPDQVDWL